MIPALKTSAIEERQRKVLEDKHTSLTNRVLRYLGSWMISQELSPRSYLLEKVSSETHPDSLQIFLTRAMDSLSLEDLAGSPHFLMSLKNLVELQRDHPEQFCSLMTDTRAEFYHFFPPLCTTEAQIDIMVDAAFQNEAKLKGTVNAVLFHIGDPRDGEESKKLLYLCLEKIIERAGSDKLIADCLKEHRENIGEGQIQALQGLKNAPQVQKVIAENLSRT